MGLQEARQEHEDQAREAAFNSTISSYDFTDPPAGMGHAVFHRARLAFEAGERFGRAKAKRDAQAWDIIYREAKSKNTAGGA